MSAWPGSLSAEEASAIVDYVLGGTMGVLFILAILQLVQIMIDTKGQPMAFAAKKMFHFVIVVLLAVRAPFFIVVPLVADDSGCAYLWLMISWNHIAETLFVSAYFILLLFWADFLSMLTGRGAHFLRQRFWFIVLFSSLIIVLVVTLCILSAVATYSNSSNCHVIQSDLVTIDSTWELINDTWFLAMACGFAYYGYQLHYEMTQHMALGIKMKDTGLRSIVTIGVICTLCFLLQCGTGIYSTTIQLIGKQEASNFNLPWWGTLLFYSFSEILPTILMLILLGHLPKRSSVHQTGGPTITVNSFLTVDRVSRGYGSLHGSSGSSGLAQP